MNVKDGKRRNEKSTSISGVLLSCLSFLVENHEFHPGHRREDFARSLFKLLESINLLPLGPNHHHHQSSIKFLFNVLSSRAMHSVSKTKVMINHVFCVAIPGPHHTPWGYQATISQDRTGQHTGTNEIIALV